MYQTAQTKEKSSPKTLHLLFSEPQSLFMQKKMNYQKNTADPSATERLKLYLTKTLT